MANPSILMLSNLLKDLQENPHQPYLMGALRGAKGTFGFDEDLRSNVGPQVEGSTFTGPEVEGSTFVGPEMEGSTIPSGNDPQLTNLAPPPDESMSPPPGIAGASSPSVPPGGAGPSPAVPEGDSGGFWQSNQAKDMGSLLASSLGGALGGAIGGNWRMGAAAGGMDAVKTIQAKQEDALKRMHGAWEAAYNDAMALPVEVHTTPGLEVVAQAQQALIKDLQDGKVDNEKNLSNWFKAKAMYGKEIEDVQLNSKIAQQNKVQEAQFANTAALQQQEGEKWFRMAQDTSLAPEERAFAQSKVEELNKAKNEQEFRISQQQADKARWDAQGAHNAASLGLQKESLGIQRQGVEQRGTLAREGMQSRERVAKLAGFNSAVKASVVEQMKAGELDEGAAYLKAMQQLGGVQLTSPGNAMILGEPVKLETVFGQRPELWDHDGTPSAKGWQVLLSTIRQTLTSAEGQASQPLTMSGYAALQGY